MQDAGSSGAAGGALRARARHIYWFGAKRADACRHEGAPRGKGANLAEMARSAAGAARLHDLDGRLHLLLRPRQQLPSA